MSDYVKNLADERAKAWEQAKAVLDVAAAENRDLTAEEAQTFDRINSELDAKDARIKGILDAEQRARDIEDSRARAGVAANLGGEVKPDVDADDATVRRLLNGEIRTARFEKRAITKSSASPTRSRVRDLPVMPCSA